MNSSMQIKRFTPDNRTTINWASGTSTEVFIHPAGANFTDRNFIFRISTATVEAEESTFTLFEGITRHLMILKGSLELIHEERYTKHLQPYDKDVFSGEWNTRSKGKVTDFNLMLKGGAMGSLVHHHMDEGSSALFTAATEFYFIYLASGTAAVSNGDIAKAGDLLWIQYKTDVTIHAEEPCELVLIEVSLN